MLPFTLAVIMKNEKKHIKHFLDSVKKNLEGLEYEIVINDTGSSDGCDDIALLYGAKIIRSDWRDDFSFSRNYVAEHASYDTIIVLDCDEYITFFDASASLPDNPHSIGRLVIKNLFIGSDGDDSYTTVLPRIYNRKFAHFEGNIHEQIVPRDHSLPQYYDAKMYVTHYGYYGSPNDLSEKTSKYEKMLLNDLKSNPNDPYTLFQLGQTLNMAHDFEGAIAYYEKGLALNPDVNLEYVIMMITALGNDLIKIGKPEEAAKLSRWSEQLKDNSDYLCMLGLAYLRSGKLMDSMQTYLSALSSGTSKTDGTSSYIPLYNMGVINEMLGNKEGALSLYRQCDNYEPALKRIKELEII